MQRARRLFIVLLTLAVATAGCLGGGGGGADVDTQSDDGTGGDGGGADGDGNATVNRTPTLSEAPTWVPGDWWRVKVDAEILGESYTITRVVAGEEGGDYRVGMPVDGFSDPVVLVHLPGVGNIAKSDLSFNVHNELFQPLDFPLTQGKTWTTSWYGQEMEMEVVSVDGSRATVEMTLNNETTELVYDATARAITQFEGSLGTTYEVVDHGTNYTGEVRVPHGRQQFIAGRVAGAFDFTLSPAAPTESLDVPPELDRASIALIVGGIGPAPQGYYHEVATDPNGTTYEATHTGALMYELFVSESPGGTWEFEHVAAGVGAAATEIIAYHVQDVVLPVGGEGASGAPTEG